MAYYRRCGRCGGSMDPAEGLAYPGEGVVCEECARELERQEVYRRRWSLSREQMRELLDELPDVGETA